MRYKYVDWYDVPIGSTKGYRVTSHMNGWAYYIEEVYDYYEGTHSVSGTIGIKCYWVQDNDANSWREDYDKAVSYGKVDEFHASWMNAIGRAKDH